MQFVHSGWLFSVGKWTLKGNKELISSVKSGSFEHEGVFGQIQLCGLHLLPKICIHYIQVQVSSIDCIGQIYGSKNRWLDRCWIFFQDYMPLPLALCNFIKAFMPSVHLLFAIIYLVWTTFFWFLHCIIQYLPISKNFFSAYSSGVPLSLLISCKVWKEWVIRENIARLYIISWAHFLNTHYIYAFLCIMVYAVEKSAMARRRVHSTTPHTT